MILVNKIRGHWEKRAEFCKYSWQVPRKWSNRSLLKTLLTSSWMRPLQPLSMLTSPFDLDSNYLPYPLINLVSRHVSSHPMATTEVLTLSSSPEVPLQVFHCNVLSKHSNCSLQHCHPSAQTAEWYCWWAQCCEVSNNIACCVGISKASTFIQMVPWCKPFPLTLGDVQHWVQ